MHLLFRVKLLITQDIYLLSMTINIKYLILTTALNVTLGINIAKVKILYLQSVKSFQSSKNKIPVELSIN